MVPMVMVSFWKNDLSVKISCALVFSVVPKQKEAFFPSSFTADSESVLSILIIEICKNNNNVHS